MKRWPSGKPQGWSTNPLFWGALRREQTPDRMIIERVHLTSLLGTGERGAIVPPPVKIIEDGFTGTGFDLDAMRATVLLFEKIAYPLNNAISVGSIVSEVGEFDGIEDLRIEVSGSINPEELFPISLSQTFNQLNQREPDMWTLARGPHGLQLPPDLLGGMTGFKLKLENALLVPDRSVPFEDIINFREQRKPELMALRHHMEELALQVTKDGLGGLAETIALERFIQSMKDHQRAIGERNWLKQLFGVDIKFNWNQLVGGAMLAPLSWEAAAGVAVSTLSLESSVGLKKVSESPQPFEYVFRAEREL